MADGLSGVTFLSAFVMQSILACVSEQVTESVVAAIGLADVTAAAARREINEALKYILWR